MKEFDRVLADIAHLQEIREDLENKLIEQEANFTETIAKYLAKIESLEARVDLYEGSKGMSVVEALEKALERKERIGGSVIVLYREEWCEGECIMNVQHSNNFLCLSPYEISSPMSMELYTFNAEDCLAKDWRIV